MTDFLQLSEDQQAFIHEQVASGRYATADAVVDTGLKLVEAREKKLAQLRQEIQAAIAEDVWSTEEEVMARLEETLAPFRG